MVIRPKPEIIHPVLGPIRFDNGQPHENVGGSIETPPKWVGRPNGWHDGDLEVLIACAADGPCQLSVERAVFVFRDLKKIEQQARSMSQQSSLDVAWLDCMETTCVISLTDGRNAYILWEATLDPENNIVKLTEGRW